MLETRPRPADAVLVRHRPGRYPHLVGGLIYVLLARALYSRIDDNLHAVMQIATTSLTNDLAEGQDYADAARSTAAELSSHQQMLAIYDADGGCSRKAVATTTWRFRCAVRPESLPSDVTLLTVAEARRRRPASSRDPARDALRRPGTRYDRAIGSVRSSRPTRNSNRCDACSPTSMPIALAAGRRSAAGSWRRQSLAPVVAMAERARKIGIEDLSGRLPVANPRDELGVARRDVQRAAGPARKRH